MAPLSERQEAMEANSKVILQLLTWATCEPGDRERKWLFFKGIRLVFVVVLLAIDNRIHME
jgi:hypothetical protein